MFGDFLVVRKQNRLVLYLKSTAPHINILDGLGFKIIRIKIIFDKQGAYQKQNKTNYVETNFYSFFFLIKAIFYIYDFIFSWKTKSILFS